MIRTIIKNTLPTDTYIRLGIKAAKILTKTKLTLGIKTKRPLQKLQFEVHLAEHCNLNCSGCDNYSPLAAEEFVDVAEFQHDFEQLAKTFNHECERIYLLGGEPLLHPQIKKLMKIARQNFMIGEILIVTNGILLPQMEPEFWQAANKNDIKIRATHYPIKIDLEKIEQMCQRYHVDFSYFGDGILKELWCWSVDSEGKQNVEQNFGMCSRANKCIFLQHGKLFTCSSAPNAHHFNKKFGTKMEVVPRDYVDIYNCNNSTEILKKMSEPIPFCRYCNLLGIHGGIPWHVSKQEKDEWL